MNSMDEPSFPKNLVVKNNKVYHRRWTILMVEAAVVDRVKRYSKTNDVSTSRALKELILRKTTRKVSDGKQKN